MLSFNDEVLEPVQKMPGEERPKGDDEERPDARHGVIGQVVKGIP